MITPEQPSTQEPLTRLTETDLTTIEERAARALPTPWRWEPELSCIRTPMGRIPITVGVQTAVFIAAAREDVPRLASEVRYLRAALGVICLASNGSGENLWKLSLLANHALNGTWKLEGT